MGELGNAVRHATLGMNASLNQTGSDGIDPNAFGGQFVCQAWGKGLNRSFIGCLKHRAFKLIHSLLRKSSSSILVV